MGQIIVFLDEDSTFFFFFNSIGGTFGSVDKILCFSSDFNC